jgi:hypothetical protein
MELVHILESRKRDLLLEGDRLVAIMKTTTTEAHILRGLSNPTGLHLRGVHRDDPKRERALHLQTVVIIETGSLQVHLPDTETMTEAGMSPLPPPLGISPRPAIKKIENVAVEVGATRAIATRMTTTIDRRWMPCGEEA